MLTDRKKPLQLYLLFILGALLLAGCRGVLELQIERVQPQSAASLGMIAYITGGDVWLADLDTNEQTRLTRDGHNSRPRLSPDGNWVVYLKGDYLYLNAIPSHEEIQLSEGGISDYAWSPLGLQLAYLSTNGLAIWDGPTQTSRDFRVDLTALHHLAWDPLGNWLVVDNREGTPRSIRQISTIGREDRLVYSAPDLMNIPRLAGWSPDGRWILIWLGSRAEVVAQDGLPLCWISVDGGQFRCSDEVTLLWQDYLSWSPDGRLAFIAGGLRETWVGKGLVYLELDSQTANWLISPEEQAPIQPAWSPDGQRIVYSAGPAVPLSEAYESLDQALMGRQIWVIEIENGRRQQLTNDKTYRDERPIWSADGSHILFARLNEESASLWLMNADGSGLRQIVSELTPRPDPFGEYGHIDWDQWWDWNQRK